MVGLEPERRLGKPIEAFQLPWNQERKGKFHSNHIRKTELRENPPDRRGIRKDSWEGAASLWEGAKGEKRSVNREKGN